MNDPMITQMMNNPELMSQISSSFGIGNMNPNFNQSQTLTHE